MKKSSLSLVFIFFALLLRAQSPTFQWAKPLRGTAPNCSAFGTSVAVDKYGNVYSTGPMFGVTDMDPGPGTFTVGNGGSGFYVSKLDALGNFVWATFSKGFSYSIAVDTASNPHITGFFAGIVDFDPGPGTYTLSTIAPSTVGGQDLFALKLSAQGNFMWAKQMGQYNNKSDFGYCISVDVSGNVYLAGTIADDILVTKMDASGNNIWIRQLGSQTTERAYGMAIDSAGNVYTTGFFIGTMDFDPGPATFNMSALGPNGIFILKLDNSGNFGWAKEVGGNVSETSRAMTADPAGNIIIVGDLPGVGDFDPGPGTYTLGPNGTLDFFILKLNSSGNFMWAKSIGTFGASAAGYAIASAGENDIYITGFFSAVADFDPSPVATYSLASISGNPDVFILKLTGSGYFAWAKQVGGYSTDGGLGIAVGQSGGIYITGQYQQTCDFDPDAAVYYLTATGTEEAFVLKLLECSISQINVASTNGIICAGTSATLNVSGAVTYTWNTGANTTTLAVSPTVTTIYTVQSTNMDACVNSATITQLVDLCAGIKNSTGDLSKPTIYPNPNTGSFILKGIQSSAFYSYELMDASGRVLEKSAKEIKDENVLFDFSGNKYLAGLYVLRLNAGDNRTAIKFIIE